MADEKPANDQAIKKRTAATTIRRAWSRRLFDGLSTFYLLSLAVVLGLLNTAGERNWLGSILLYVPQHLFLLPALLFASVYLFKNRRRFYLYAVVVLGFVLGHMDFQFSFGRSAKGKTLKVLTNNIGSRKISALSSFILEQNPDIIVFQEAWRRDRSWSQALPQKYVANLGQFLFISRYPIKNSAFVPNLGDMRSGPIAAWFEVEYEGQSLVVYNVRLPTPRPDFEKLRGKGFLYELARGGGVLSQEVREDYKRGVENRIRLAKGLQEHLRNEKRRYIVAGDFNAPSQSYIIDLFQDGLTDVFAARGKGYGFTFPATSMNPLTLFGAWLRLDYIFVGNEWRPLDCSIEPRHPGQHRAVVATLELQPPAD